METQSVLRTERNTYLITCPSCGHSKELAHDRLPQQQRSLKVTCPCHYVFRLEHDRRRFERQDVDLLGYLFEMDSKELWDSIKITDLSRGGIGFVTQQTFIQVGETFIVGFFLDDEFGSWIEEPIVIRKVQADDLVGAEFVDSDCYHSDLDLYLTTFSIVT